MKVHLFILLFIHINLILVAQQVSEPCICVYFSKPPGQLEVHNTALKYNKEFALSFHLDDGNRDIYTHAFPLLEGGVFKLNGQQTASPGYFYTDGCGNLHSFKMASAIYSYSTYNMTDLHGPDAGNTWIKWNELARITDSGWAVYNHGLTDKPAEHIQCEFWRNHSYVRRMIYENTKTPLDMRVASLPFGNENFIPVAFDSGYDLCLWMNDFGVPSLSINSVNNWENFLMGVALLDRYNNLTEYIDQIAGYASMNNPQWACAFTHQITGNQLEFQGFKNMMNYVVDNYGAQGNDNVWVASAEEVYDYLLLNSKIEFMKRQEGRKLEITIEKNYPSGLRWYASSLVLRSDAIIDSISFYGIESATYCNTGKYDLININWEVDNQTASYQEALKYIRLVGGNKKLKQCIKEITHDYIKTIEKTELRKMLINTLKENN